MAGLSGVMAAEPSPMTLNIAIETALLQRPEPEAFSKDILAAKARVARSAAFAEPGAGDGDIEPRG